MKCVLSRPDLGVWLLSFLGAAACCAQPVSEPGPALATLTATQPGKGRVYFYRYKQFTGSALEPSVFCDAVQLARMDNGRYFVAEIVPGAHVFHSNDSQSGVRLTVEGGAEYYVRVELATGLLKGHGRLVLVPREQGSFEIQKLKPLGADKIKSRELVSTSQTP